MIDRVRLGAIIGEKIVRQAETLNRDWQETAPINHFVVDDLLPPEIAISIRQAFPSSSSMMLRKNLRELKYVSSQMNRHNPILEEIIFAFQQREVVEVVQAITQIQMLQPDEHLYAGGISMMGSGHFLNPHLDNSHDKERARYRVLNLLYYVSPNWSLERGANLEVWPNGTKAEPKTIVSQFNRLAVMVTNQHSWHSVSKNATNEDRCCISNYYFSPHPVGIAEYFHPTSFRGRPDQPIRDAVLQADAIARATIRKIFPDGVGSVQHVYKKDGNGD